MLQSDWLGLAGFSAVRLSEDAAFACLGQTEVCIAVTLSYGLQLTPGITSHGVRTVVRSYSLGHVLNSPM